MNTSAMEKTALPIRLENITPILHVSDMATSRAFYVGILGFKEAEWGDDNFTSIARDNTGIYLCRNGQGHPGTWIWMGFDGDIHRLHELLKVKGVKVRMAPTNFSYAMEMHIEDPDGHVLRLGTDPDQTIPFVEYK
jgi:catechol 2,3-dioxygenase-like lactoylglutathione lyase family enzyme